MSKATHWLLKSKRNQSNSQGSSTSPLIWLMSQRRSEKVSHTMSQRHKQSKMIRLIHSNVHQKQCSLICSLSLLWHSSEITKQIAIFLQLNQQTKHFSVLIIHHHSNHLHFQQLLTVAHHGMPILCQQTLCLPTLCLPASKSKFRLAWSQTPVIHFCNKPSQVAFSTLMTTGGNQVQNQVGVHGKKCPTVLADSSLINQK